MTTSKITSSNDNQYGSVANGSTYSGVTIGSGYDVTIKRESHGTALVSVEKVGTQDEWLSAIEVEAGDDLQALARQIAQCPSAELEETEMVSSDEDAWVELADRWDAIALK
jgi:hypothetical protein